MEIKLIDIESWDFVQRLFIAYTFHKKWYIVRNMEVQVFKWHSCSLGGLLLYRNGANIRKKSDKVFLWTYYPYIKPFALILCLLDVLATERSAYLTPIKKIMFPSEQITVGTLSLNAEKWLFRPCITVWSFAYWLNITHLESPNVNVNCFLHQLKIYFLCIWV